MNFNNVYVYVLPKATKLITNNYVNYLTPAQKQLIISSLIDKKTLTSEVIVMDPVYKAVTVGISSGLDSDATCNCTAVSKLVVTLLRETKTPVSVIKDKIKSIFETYFDPSIITLGYTVNIPEITNSILDITGVKQITTINTKTNNSINGVSLIVFNPSYPTNDVESTNKTFTVADFQTVYLDDIEEIMTRVEVVPEVNQSASIVNF